MGKSVNKSKINKKETLAKENQLKKELIKIIFY